MNQFLPFKFSSLDDFLNSLPADELQLVNYLRNMIKKTLPECNERLAYNVPYYYGRKRICFIWPASIPWGKVKMNGVNLGFCNGNLLYDPNQFLDKGNRKQVYMKTFFSVNEINAVEKLLISFLVQASRIDLK
ncbi:MAG: DUF1801 domain-containing protein [Calditrichaeota bacterium]|nr:DUF1801 domain-containing protein [Calditrichota bacterium]